MAQRRSLEFGSRLAWAALSLLLLVGCGDDDPDPTPREPGLVQVQTPADLEEAFLTAVAGDTIQILSGFAGTTFDMPRGLRLTAEQAPILVFGDSRSAFRPHLVFPDSVDGITISGHTTNAGRTTLRYIDVDGGRNGLVLDNSTVDVTRSSFRGSRLDGLAASGAGSQGSVTLCLFENNNRFGISTQASAALSIVRNTVVGAGDCGFSIDSAAEIRGNNIVQALNYGIILKVNSGSASMTCNNAFGTIVGPNYVSAVIPVDPALNLELNPMFCPGLYSLRSGSPLAALNSPAGCGTIGAFEPECD